MFKWFKYYHENLKNLIHQSFDNQFQSNCCYLSPMYLYTLSAIPQALTQFLMFLPVFVSQGFCGHLGKDTIDGVALASTVRQKHLRVFYFKNQFYMYSLGVELIPHVHTLDAGLPIGDVLYNHLYHLITYFTKLY